jgi:ABC-type multidrug transport system ATPase subunit
VDGRVAALIELGAGFHPEISGRENVFINGTLLGLSRGEIEDRYDSIVAFSGLEAFMDEPVKNYSSGMYVRLGFAVAVHTDPDVLLVDEVLSVGDEAFGHRCVRRMEELLAAGKTMLLVSHSLDLVSRLCDRVLWLDGGHQRLLGSPRRTIDAYRQAVAEAEGREHQQEHQAAGEAPAERWGSGAARIHGVRLLRGREEEGREEGYLLVCGEPVTFEIEVEAATALKDFVFGIAIHTPRGAEVWGTNTDLQGLEGVRLQGAATVCIDCPELRLAPGEYTVDLAVHAQDGTPYDYRRRVLAFTVSSQERGEGVYFPRHQWRFEGGVQCRRRDGASDT